MENKIILLDTSVLIDVFRRKVKENSFYYHLLNDYQEFAVSTITRFEVFVGQRDNQNEFWNNFYQKVKIIDFDDHCAFTASAIVKQLKSTNQMIEMADILIGGTAIANNLPLATLNRNHFNRIANLHLV
jgi:predicted nucleic acid-binding protein